MNNVKELLKSLSSLTLHALLLTTFGIILITIYTLSDYALVRFCNPVGGVVKVVLLVLEIPFFFAVLDVALNEVAGHLKGMRTTVRPAVTYVRRRSARRARTRRSI